MKYFFIILFTLLFSPVSSANLTLKLSHQFLEQPLILHEKVYTTSNNEELTFTKLKYYLGNILLTYNNGKTYTDLIRYHLIDFEKSETMLLVLNNIPEGTIKNIGFSIGVDSLTNSNGLMDGDLDPLKGMYWSWSSGFINFKLEGTCSNCSTEKKFAYHIGGFIAPNESFQTTSIPVEKKVTATEMNLEITIDIGTLFIENKISTLSKIMSPSIKSKQFSEQLPQIFSIK